MLLVAKNIISDSNLFFYLYNFSQSTTFEYNSKLNLTHYKNLTTKKDYNFNSLIFYRPWIIGCHYAKSPTEMINYAVKAIELWLKDNEII